MSRHFVAYHNSEMRGAELERDSRGSFETNKPVLPENGDVLWCFEGRGRPRQYRLVKRGIVIRSDANTSGPSIIRYQDATVVDAIVNGFPWFETLKEEQSNFSFGVNLIRNPSLVRELERCAAGQWADSIEEDVAAIEQDRSIPETTRKALIDARRGHGTFRKKLDIIWENACAATSCTVREVLRASHIKPWRQSTDKERLDPNNGILLSANIDILFDRGLVSFDDSGRMLVSSRLATSERRALGLPAHLRRTPDARQLPYLKYHRKRFGF